MDRLASVSVGTHGRQLVESRYEPRIVDLAFLGRTTPVSCYSGRFRLLNVVFDVFGWVSGEFGLHANLSEDLDVPCFQSCLPSIP